MIGLLPRLATALNSGCDPNVLANAALPWSPASCRRLLRRALDEGATMDEALARLDRAELGALLRNTGGRLPRSEVRP